MYKWNCTTPATAQKFSQYASPPQLPLETMSSCATVWELPLHHTESTHIGIRRDQYPHHLHYNSMDPFLNNSVIKNAKCRK